MRSRSLHVSLKALPSARLTQIPGKTCKHNLKYSLERTYQPLKNCSLQQWWIPRVNEHSEDAKDV
eukprot:1691368-Amphidinium_carterae.1